MVLAIGALAIAKFARALRAFTTTVRDAAAVGTGSHLGGIQAEGRELGQKARAFVRTLALGFVGADPEFASGQQRHAVRALLEGALRIPRGGLGRRGNALQGRGVSREPVRARGRVRERLLGSLLVLFASTQSGERHRPGKQEASGVWCKVPMQDRGGYPTMATVRTELEDGTAVPRGLARRGLLLGGASLALACDRASPLAEGRRSVDLWFTYGGKNREVLEALVQRFNASQSADFVRPVFQGDYFEGLAKLRVALAARRAPALSHVVGEVVPYLAEAGVLEPLNGYPGVAELDVLPALGQSGSWVSGESRPLVALPFNRSTPIAYLNGELFASRGLRAPETWQELRETARELSSNAGTSSRRYGFGCPVNWWFWVALVGQAGGQVVEQDGRISLGEEAGVRALEYWQTLVTRDGSMKPPPGRDYNAWEQTNQDFLAGRAAMIWTSTAFLSYLEENARFPVIAAPLPKQSVHAVPTGGTHWVILKDAPQAEKEAAFRFLRFMHQPTQAVDWATRTGYIPVTASAIRVLESNGFYREHPNHRVAVDQLAAAMPWPWSTSLFRLQREIVQPRLERAVLGGGSARALLDEARELARREVLP